MRNTTKSVPTTWSPSQVALVDGVEITHGQKLVVDGSAGTYTFRHVSRDGSLTCWGGEPHNQSWRSFSADRCHLPGWVAPAAATDVTDKPSRASKYAAFEMWASVNQGKTFSTTELIEISGFSAPTLTKYVTDSMFFEKVKRGQWRVLIIAEKE